MKKYFILLFILVSFIFTTQSAQAAALRFSPPQNTVFKDESFIVDLFLDSENEELNAFEINLRFNPAILHVEDISRGGSVATLWVRAPAFSNQDGSISFIGGMPGGFNGVGLIAKITFSAKSIGSSQLSFDDEGKVLLNDGKGSEAVLLTTNGSFVIIEQILGLPVISSPTHQEQSTWYADPLPRFNWDTEEEVAYRYTLSREPNDIPFSPENAPIGEVRYANVGEGIFYFLLSKREIGDLNFSSPVRYRIMVDMTSPAPFKAEVAEIEGKEFLIFSTTDAISGVDHYEVLKAQTEGAGLWRIAESPYLLSDEDLHGIIKVKAVDKAGNEQIFTIEPTAKISLLESAYVLLGLAVLSAIIVVWKNKFHILARIKRK